MGCRIVLVTMMSALIAPLLPSAWGQLSGAGGPSACVASANDRDSAVAPDGLATADWAGIRAAHDAARYAAEVIDGGHRARNPGQQWTTNFDGHGFTTAPDAGGWSWGLELVRYGFGADAQDVTAPRSISANEGRVEYVWDERLTEWWNNDSRGLEHGYTVQDRPATDGWLTLWLAARGGLSPVVTEGGRAVRFTNEAGATVVSYAGLTVHDAEGVNVAAEFTVEGARLCLTVEDACAQYPLTIDPLAQQAYLKASNPYLNDFFGASVAVSGDTVVVGVSREDSNATGVNSIPAYGGGDESGAAYVFTRSGGAWSQQAYLKASNTGGSDQFGYSVAVSGDTVIIGAPWEDSSAVGVDGNQSSNGSSDAGAAYVFVRSGSTWSQQAYLKASNTGQDDQFGYYVAVSGDTVVVGANGEDSSTTGVNGPSNNATFGSGAAYVFVRSGSIWSQQAYLKQSNTGMYDDFGVSVAISGDTAVVGARWEDSSAAGVNGNQSDNSASAAGAAYVFVRSGSTWSQQAYLKASNPGSLDNFGYSVAVSGDTLVVGAKLENSGATGVNGNQSSNTALDSGAAYVFARTGSIWSQQAYLKASNTESEDFFGNSVALSGDTIVIGADGEDSSASGIDGNQSDNGGTDAGAAYVFIRTGSAWSQQAYLKASNSGGAGHFGRSVSVSGDTVAAGADGEDVAAYQAGAAYVFDVCASIAVATPFGVGKAGTAGIPVLSSSSPKLWTSTVVSISNGLSGASPTLMFAGFAPASLAFDGGTLLVSPAFVVVLPALNGSGSLMLPVPLTVWACGLNIYLQAMFVDPGAAGFYHTAQTNGLAWNIGA